MKRMLGLTILCMAVLSAVYISAEEKSGAMMGRGMMDEKGDMMMGGHGMMGRGMMDEKDGMMMGGRGMMGMMGMCPMMKSMMERTVVATGDGGIIVVTGNKLTKYDKDLNVVKEIELKMDMEGMQKMMDNMKSMCPFMGKGMMGGGKSKGPEAASTEESGTESEHESHHQ